MSEFDLEALKRELRVVHSSDDAQLQDLLDEAEDEALQYLEMTAFPVETVEGESPAERVPRSIRRAVFLLVQGAYDEADASKLVVYRERAETLLFPFRENLGI